MECLKIVLLTSAFVWTFWLLYSKFLSAIIKRPLKNILTNEVYSYFPLILLLLVSLFFRHRNSILFISLSLVVFMKLAIIIRPAWFKKTNSILLQKHIFDYVLIPALIYAFYYRAGNIHGGIDMFHEGERLAPLNALLRGKIPFRDIYLQHGLFHNAYRPLIASKLFGGPSLAADRSLGLVLAPLGAVTFYILGLQIFRTRLFALLSILVLTSAAASTWAWHTLYGLSDRHAAGVVSIIILVSHLINRRGRTIYGLHIRPLLAGVFCCLAIFYILDAGVYALIIGSLLLIVFGMSFQGRIIDKLLPLISYLAGLSIMFLPFAAYFALHGALDDLLWNFYAQARYLNLVWGTKFPPLFAEFSKVESLISLKTFALSETFKWYLPVLIYLITAVYLMHQLPRSSFWNKKSNNILIILLVSGTIHFRTTLGMTGRYHLYSAIVFSWVICTFFAEQIIIGTCKKLRANSKSIAAAAWRLIPVLLFTWYLFSLYNPINTIRANFNILSNYRSIERNIDPPLHRAGGIKVPENQVSQIREIVEYIQKNTERDETILDFTSNGAYYFFADRPMATKYHQMCYTATEAMQNKVIESLENHETNLAIFMSGSWGDSIGGVSSFDRYPLIAKYLTENLRESVEIGDYIILRRKQGPDRVSAASLDNISQMDWRSFGDDLVLYLDFNEGSSFTARDMSQYQNDGILHGSWWTKNGKYGKGMKFSGGGAWVEVPDSPSLDITDELTMALWVYPTRYTGQWTRYIAKHWHVHTSPWTAYGIWDNGADSGKTGFAISIDGGNEVRCGQGATPKKPLNQWTHLAATYNGKEMKLYYNGEIQATLAASGKVDTNDVSLAIGGNNIANAEYFVGVIDEVAVFNRSLTQSEIKKVMMPR